MRTKGLALALAAGLTTGGAVSAQDAAEAVSIGVGQQVRGEITSADTLSWSDGSRSERFSVELDQGQAVRFSATGPLNAVIAVFLEGELVAGPAGREGNAGVVLHAPRAGRYVVAVSGRDGASFGPFTLVASEQQVYAGSDVRVGAAVTDWADSPRTIPLRIDEHGVYAISMESDGFDTTLMLEGNGVSLSNDDSGGGSNSRLTAILAPGTYQLTLGGFLGQMGDEYRLQVSPRELPPGTAAARAGTLVAGTPVTALYQGAAVDYRLVVPVRGLARIAMDSSEIDPVLVLEGDGLVLQDDDSGGRLNALIETVLEPGEYTVRAGSYGNGGGVFTLSATLSEVPPGTDRIVGTLP